MRLTADIIIGFIEPESKRAEQPIVDDYTRKIAYNILHGENGVVVSRNKTRGVFIMEGVHTNGYHECICGAESEDSDFRIAPNLYTNSLSAHYVAFHRESVPVEDLEKIRELTCPDEYQPSPEILMGQVEDGDKSSEEEYASTSFGWH